jgi:hypothetical protein|tara:strand:- start:240 stop:398 length:159 start_codon:yes stop_codon:yes gene_type:complete
MRSPTQFTCGQIAIGHISAFPAACFGANLFQYSADNWLIAKLGRWKDCKYEF